MLMTRRWKQYTALTLIIVSTAINANLPAKYYSCQVKTINNVDGLVFIRAVNIRNAESGALSVKALTLDNKMAAVVAIIECIKRPAEHFSDTKFQFFYERLKTD